jgi:hypothetical protein
MDILVNVANQKLRIATNLKNLISGTQEFVKFVFNLNGDWDNLMTFAQFTQNGKSYNQYLDDENSVYLPSEIGVGTCTLMLYGSNDKTIATTNYLTLDIDDNILVKDANSTEISQSLYTQLVTKINSMSNWNSQSVADLEAVDADLQKQINTKANQIDLTTEISRAKAAEKVNADAIALKASQKDVDNLTLKVTELESNEVVEKLIKEAVVNEMKEYLANGYLASMTITDGSIARSKVDTNFEGTLAKADTAMQPSVYDPQNLKVDIFSYAQGRADIVKKDLDTVKAELQDGYKLTDTMIYTKIGDAIRGAVTLSRTYAQALLADYKAFTIKVVDELPVTGEPMTFYLVPNKSQTGYDKYWWITDDVGDAKWDVFGSSSTLVVTELPEKGEEDVDYILKLTTGCLYYKWIDGMWQVVAGSITNISSKLPEKGNAFTDYFVLNDSGSYVHYRYINGSFHAIGLDAYTKDEINEKIATINDTLSALQNSIDEIKADLDTKENASNKKNAIDGSSVFYPSNIAVKNYVTKELIEPKSEIAQLKLSKANLVQSHNLFDWDKLLTTKSNIFTVSKTEDEGYHITGRTANRYSQILSNQELSLEDGDYYLCDNVTNNATVSVCCQLILIDTDGYRTYYNNTKVTIDKSKYTSIFLSVQTDASVGEVDSVIYPILCKYENINIPYLPNKVADGVPLIARHIADTKNYTDHNLDTKENISNKIDTINFPSTTYYPSSKAVWDYVNSKISTLINDIENLKNNKVNITDFNIFKDSTNSNISTNSTNIENLKNELAEKNKKINDLSIKVTTDKAGNTTISDSSNNNIVGLNMYGKTTQSTTPTPTNPVAIKDINNPKITVTNDSDSQSINIQCTLRGIGNVCDTLTVNSDGTGYITQRLFAERITSQRKSTSYEWNYSKATHRFFRNDYSYSFDVKDNKPLILCSHLDVGENEKNTDFDNSIGWINVGGVGIAIRITEFDGDIAKFKKWLDDNEVYVVAPRSKPITVNLSKDEVDKIISLHTYYLNTTIVSDCDCQVEYVADTKHYIDNKFNELATALVAHESEVM